MKIAIVDHVGNKGGVSRVIRKLLPELAQIEPKNSITYFGSALSIDREDFFKDFKKYKINIIKLNSLNFNFDYSEKNFFKKFINVLQRKIFSHVQFLPTFLTGNLKKELENKLAGFDLIYFPWPYLIELPNISKPMVATFHDFNFRYYFSGIPTYSKNQLTLLNQQMEKWLTKTKIIVSNNFTADELKKFYPNIQKKINIIPLGPYSEKKNLDIETYNRIKKKFNLPNNYIFCGTNTCAHKNLNPMFAAINILKKKNILINLVLTGPGTEIINGESDEYGVKLVDDNKKDIFGLGYVSNLELDMIIENSSAIISPEMYTSDNGPATDGWIRGKPVIISDIPSNREHIENQKVFAELFNYRSPENIAEKIEKVLKDSNQNYQNEAKKSMEAMNKIKWQDVALKYLEVFNDS